MTFFDVLTLIGGLCLFLFGMNVMGDSLERRAGNSLSSIIGRLTTNKFAGFLTGLGVTAVIQSSSATTVMAVGFVNSGLMTLSQSIGIIMGANIGTTVTAWILSLGGIESSNFIVQLFKPMSFTPVLGLIGLIFYMAGKTSKKKDTGTILLGFAVLMFGMDIMSGAVSGLKDVPQFRQLFVLFTNPVLGVLAGAILTAVIQSSSASVGILQALTVTGQISYGAALPIIMGQNIGTCVTALISSVGANRNARRVAIAHLAFNIMGTVIVLIALQVIKVTLAPAILTASATHFGIAISHTIFNVVCTIILFPLSGLLEKLVCVIVPDSGGKDTVTELDERLLMTPALALDACRKCTFKMAAVSKNALDLSIDSLGNITPAIAEEVRELENEADHYEDIIGNFLIKLSSQHLTDVESTESARLLRIIGDFERISDHAVNIVESSEEIKDKDISFTEKAREELSQLQRAVTRITALATDAFLQNDEKAAFEVEALEECIDMLKDKLRANHITRLQQGQCGIEVGFVWNDLITNMERISDHCSNISGCILETSHNNLNMHEGVKILKTDSEQFRSRLEYYISEYSVM